MGLSDENTEGLYVLLVLRMMKCSFLYMLCMTRTVQMHISTNQFSDQPRQIFT